MWAEGVIKVQWVRVRIIKIRDLSRNNRRYDKSSYQPRGKRLFSYKRTLILIQRRDKVRDVKIIPRYEQERFIHLRGSSNGLNQDPDRYGCPGLLITKEAEKSPGKGGHFPYKKDHPNQVNEGFLLSEYVIAIITNRFQKIDLGIGEGSAGTPSKLF